VSLKVRQPCTEALAFLLEEDTRVISS
jgi:hypothetical protein